MLREFDGEAAAQASTTPASTCPPATMARRKTRRRWTKAGGRLDGPLPQRAGRPRRGRAHIQDAGQQLCRLVTPGDNYDRDLQRLRRLMEKTTRIPRRSGVNRSHPLVANVATSAPHRCRQRYRRDGGAALRPAPAARRHPAPALTWWSRYEAHGSRRRIKSQGEA
ncbi:MAG: hypothetical protein R3A10_15345 [Caldilineaceae bacterium]